MVVLGMAVGVVLSDDTQETTLTSEDVDSFWLLFGGVLVFFMQTGFAMLEAGSVASDPAIIGNVLLKNMFDVCIGSLLWWACGYALAFGADNYEERGHRSKNGFMGHSGFFYHHFNEGAGDEQSPSTSTRFAKTYGKSFWQFQWAFASVAATIVSGAVAGRCYMGAYLLYAILISGLIYPAVVHMVWSEDGKFTAYRSTRLYQRCGVVDFAGSGVVHLTGGVAAFILVNFLKPRPYRFATKGSADATKFQKPDNAGTVFRTLGGFILWFGWYGFNAASTLALSGNGGLAAHAVMNTTLAAATGCLTSSMIYRIYKYHWYYSIFDVNRDDVDTAYSVNGIVAGLVSITAGCAVVEHWGAVVIGLIGSLLAFMTSRVMIFFHIDDVVDAVAVHAVPGIWGLWSTALFSTEYHYRLAIDRDDTGRARRCCGLFTCGRGRSLAAAIVLSLVIIAWVTAVLLPVFFVLSKCNLIVDKERKTPNNRQFRLKLCTWLSNLLGCLNSSSKPKQNIKFTDAPGGTSEGKTTDDPAPDDEHKNTGIP